MLIEVQAKRNKKSIERFANAVARELRIVGSKALLLITLRKDVRSEYGADGITMQFGNLYWIVLQSSMSLDNIGRTLAHEMIHVKQFIRGAMKILEGGLRSWMGKIVDFEKTPWLEHPWEIQAMSMEVLLYHQACNKM
jgi:hypothetical protein